MWVEDERPFDHEAGDPIAVKFGIGDGALIKGTFESVGLLPDGMEGWLVHFTSDRGVKYSKYSPVTGSSRTFFRWVEVQPEDSVNRLADARSRPAQRKRRRWMESQTRLRLNKPDKMAREVEEAEVALMKRISEKTTRCDVQVGRQTYVLNPGDHLRVWWEDGHLWSEFIQGEEK